MNANSCRHCCHHCSTADRRRFLKGVVTAAGCLSPLGRIALADEGVKVRVAAVFLAQVRNSWPYPGFDAAGRQREILAALRKGCPQVDFVPVTVQTPGEADKALDLRDQVDGYLAHVTTLSWALVGVLAAIGKLNKPTVVADEFLGGSGAFLSGVPPLVRGGGAVAVATTRLDDLVTVARQFAALGTPSLTPAEFARRCEGAYRGTFPTPGKLESAGDDLKLTDIGECAARFRQSKVLVLGRGHGGLAPRGTILTDRSCSGAASLPGFRRNRRDMGGCGKTARGMTTAAKPSDSRVVC